MSLAPLLITNAGNGYERDLGMDSKVFITNIYNRWIYPNDREAKSECTSVCSIRVYSVVLGYIDRRIELDLHTEDTVYLGVIKMSVFL